MAEDLRLDENAILTHADLARFAEFLSRSTGMNFTEAKRYYIDRRVADRMQANTIKGFADYFAFLRSDLKELEELINAFTINETYFYREVGHFTCLTDSLLPAIAAKKNPGDKIRIWVMPCATGDEAYSIAIWLLENWAIVDAYHVEIVASDINSRSLELARDGNFDERALSRLPPHLIDSYFEQSDGQQRRIIQDLRESVIFTKANIVDADTLAAQGQFDIILCRNVLIYFDNEARLAAVKNLRDRLVLEGFLILGHAESMVRPLDGFRTLRCNDTSVYQRVQSGD